jgi:TPP-dependent pyruvate/acetoin dehydrogenase alpha subunit
MYKTLVMARRFDEKTIDLMQRGKEVVPGFVHSGQGMEAIPVGACLAVRRDDYILPSHRGFAYHIAKGVPINRILAELCGRSTGVCKGKGGFHVGDIGVGDLGMGAVLGGCFVLAAGAGLSAKLRGTDQVAVCFFGDGSAQLGNFHTGLNLAGVWKLPVVYICENNHFAVSTPLHAKQVTDGYLHWGSTAGESIAQRGPVYGMPGKTVDGYDVIAVYEATREAVERARSGKGPTLLDCLAMRWHPHAEGVPNWGVSQEELQQAISNDPVRKLRTSMLETKAFTKNELDKIEEGVAAEIEAAEKFALQSPRPKPEDALEDIYA